MKSSPIIAITAGGSNNLPRNPELYLQSLDLAGGIGKFIFPGQDKAGLEDFYDGVLIPGGRDVNPFLYNEPQLQETCNEDESRTAFEYCILGDAITRSKPVMGICYGMQLINIYFGGSLYQDIGRQRPESHEHRHGMHMVTVTDNPFTPMGRFTVNSSHHQSIKMAGRGLVAFCASDDGVIEGLYSDNPSFLVGVQWHPERLDDVLSMSIFRKFVEACSKS